VTFGRALQCGIEDPGYARRIARLRAYYFDNSPDVVHYLTSVPLDETEDPGTQGRVFQNLETVAGRSPSSPALLAG
jgi:hypothetical protein